MIAMKKRLRTALLLGVAVPICMVGAQRVHATTMRPVPLPELVQLSQKVVRGTVVEATATMSPRGEVWTRYVLQKASAVKGKLTSSKRFAFLCRGGSTMQGSEAIPGIPSYVVGDEIVVLYMPTNRRCQVTGWEQGSFRVMKTPKGRTVVTSHRGRLVLGTTTTGLLLGAQVEGMSKMNAPLQISTVGQDVSASVAAADDTTATADDFMTDLSNIARSTPDRATADQASEGTMTMFIDEGDDVAVAPPEMP